MTVSVRRWRDETGDAHALVVARVALGLLLLEAALRAAGELRRGYFGAVFHWPMVSEGLVPSKAGYAAILAAEVLLAAMVVVGIRAPAALFMSAALSTYVLLCDRLQFHHNRWALACFALLLSLSPCDRSRGPLWAARLAQLQVSIIYLASGASKLLDPDWRDGRVLATRVLLYGRAAIENGVPREVVEWLGDPGHAGSLAKLAIATELLLSVGLWWPRTRAFALWWGVWFHLTIEATSRVEGFTWLMLAMYALFATPDTRARTLTYCAASPVERVVARSVGWLDWLARFQITPRKDATRRGLAVVDRDGTHGRGLRAIATIARGTPLLFPLWFPLAVLAFATQPNPTERQAET